MMSWLGNATRLHRVSHWAAAKGETGPVRPTAVHVPDGAVWILSYATLRARTRLS